MEHPTFSLDTTLAEVMSTSASAIRNIMSLKVNCVGCSINKFCTISEMCRLYNLDESAVLELLRERK